MTTDQHDFDRKMQGGSKCDHRPLPEFWGPIYKIFYDLL